MAEPHQRLHNAMNARRKELDLTWIKLGRRARVSVPTLSAIRGGVNRPSELTQHRLEDAFGWAHGSIEAILNGGDPTLVVDERAVPNDPDAEVQEVWASLTDEERERATAKASALLQLARGQDPGDDEVLDDLIRWRREHRG